MAQGFETAKHSQSLRLKDFGFELTGHGYRFIVVWLVLFVVSINYQNTLAYAFVLLLLSLVLVSTLYTIRNLLNIQVNIGRVNPVFAEQEIYFPLTLTSSDFKRHETIRFCWNGYHRITTTLEPGQKAMVEVPIQGQQRGWFSPDDILMYTEYPFGLFRVKTKLRIKTPCLVYPKPRRIAQAGCSAISGGVERRFETEQDFAGMRAYSPGDSLKHVAWKALARTNEPLTKVFSDVSTESHIFDWDTLSTLDSEEKISALTDAIVTAEAHGDTYGLKAPRIDIEANVGAEHRHLCLKALALMAFDS